jgi:hypothetical protein
VVSLSIFFALLLTERAQLLTLFAEPDLQLRKIPNLLAGALVHFVDRDHLRQHLERVAELLEALLKHLTQICLHRHQVAIDDAQVGLQGISLVERRVLIIGEPTPPRLVIELRRGNGRIDLAGPGSSSTVISAALSAVGVTPGSADTSALVSGESSSAISSSFIAGLQSTGVTLLLALVDSSLAGCTAVNRKSTVRQ